MSHRAALHRRLLFELLALLALIVASVLALHRAGGGSPLLRTIASGAVVLAVDEPTGAVVAAADRHGGRLLLLAARTGALLHTTRLPGSVPRPAW